MNTTARTFKIITIRQPWATAIMQLGKDIENRTWTTRYRGKLLIHAGYYQPTALDFNQLQQILNLKGQQIPNQIEWTRGAILGYIDLIDIITNSHSVWAMSGQYHWQLTNPYLFPTPITCPGKQGLWTPDESLQQAIQQAIK